MIELAPDRIAAAVGAAEPAPENEDGSRPERAVIDSREVAPGDLFFGLPGATEDGGVYAAGALADGAWGVVVGPEHGAELERSLPGARIFAVDDPLLALQHLARAWRRELGCPTVGITGSTGKTSVKDICRAILPRRVHASPENFNTEIGMPLAILAAPPETELLVIEMAMRGMGQIAELCEIAEPDVAAITNVGPVHLELLGTFEAIVEAKAEILHGLGDEGRAVIPEDEEALSPHLRDSLEVFTFGPGGDVFALSASTGAGRTRARIGTPHGEADFEFPFTEAHNLRNALCAIAIGVALDLDPEAMAARTARIEFSRLRGERIELPGRILLLNDCYNANPISMRAAVENLAGAESEGGRRAVAVLGGMAELGPESASFHAEVGALVRDRGIDRLIGVGELARDYSPDAWAPDADAAVPLVAAELADGDVALIKGSRSVGLERLTDGLVAGIGKEEARLIALAQSNGLSTVPVDRGAILIAGMAAMLITIFLGPKFIERLREREFGQQIREEGPQGHHTKAGTPTMGGLIIFTAIAVPYLVLSDRDTESLTVFGVALGSAAIGFADDWIKIVKRRSLGLNARWKLSCQIALAVILWWVAFQEIGLDPSLQIRLFDAEIYLGPVVYVVLSFLVLAGASNGVNLTDGLDGLAAGCCAIVFLSYLAITITTGQEDLALLSSCFVGASIGFLWFNSFPATIFMGDTGSLGLGGAIAGLAIMTQTEVLLIVLGGIFVIEALSVAIQVFTFKSFRRRVFLMAPLHHHFEMMAWSETKIMIRFWIIGAVLAGIGYTLFQNSIGS